MKLYQDPVAPNPRRVRIFLAEKGIGGFELISISIAESENRGEAFLAKNPLGLVPVLELDDGRTLAESMAICRYFEELHPEPALLGTDPYDKADVERWNRHMELELLWPVAQAFRNSHPFWKGRIPQAPDFGEIARNIALERLVWLDDILAERDFVAGDRFTVADITALAAIDFGRISKIRITPELIHLKRWHEAVSARPSASA